MRDARFVLTDSVWGGLVAHDLVGKQETRCGRQTFASRYDQVDVTPRNSSICAVCWAKREYLADALSGLGWAILDQISDRGTYDAVSDALAMDARCLARESLLVRSNSL